MLPPRAHDPSSADPPEAGDLADPHRGRSPAAAPLVTADTRADDRQAPRDGRTSTDRPTATPRHDETAAGPLRHLEAELAELDRRGLLRLPPATAGAQGRPPLVLCSNDYLGYAAAAWSGSQAVSGAGASRLVTGEHPAHAEAEGAIADWLRVGASLLFSSGYAANVGAIAALARPGDVILSDALNHASIIDGCRLSGARVVVLPHRDVEAARRALAEVRSTPGAAPTARASERLNTESALSTPGERPADSVPRTATARARARDGAPERPAHPRVWLVTESLFSMDGDAPDLRALRALCDAHDAALYVDEAHALGVLGPEGRGACAEAGVVPDVLVGTLGKALGLQGAFVAGSPVLRAYLWNRARSFVFSTGVSPALASRVADHVRRVADDDGARARLHEVSRRLRAGLAELGVPLVPDSRGPILPWLVGSPAAAVSISRALREDGIVVQPIRPPTVPAGTSRLRITATATLTGADIDRALRAFAGVISAPR